MIKFRAVVISGNQIGAKFGIATANLQLQNKLHCKHGVYFVIILIGQQRYHGLLHIGHRQTFQASFSIEVHILDFQQNIYGHTLEVHICQFHRPIYKFHNADQLFTQIEQDMMQARKFFWRKNIYQQWQNLTLFDKKQLSQQAYHQIIRHERFRQAPHIFAYLPDPQCEISFLPALWQNYPTKKFFFPKILGKKLCFVEMQNWEQVVYNHLGLLEPLSATPVQIPQWHDLLLVPALAASGDGYRLGRGGGFYDRFLRKCPDGYQITVLPKFAMSAMVPHTAHDQMVDEVIVVESPTIQPSGSRGMKKLTL